jgi:hypothetical protein
MGRCGAMSCGRLKRSNRRRHDSPRANGDSGFAADSGGARPAEAAAFVRSTCTRQEDKTVRGGRLQRRTRRRGGLFPGGAGVWTARAVRASDRASFIRAGMASGQHRPGRPMRARRAATSHCHADPTSRRFFLFQIFPKSVFRTRKITRQ